MEWVRTLIVQAEWLPLTRKTSIVWLKVPPLGGIGSQKALSHRRSEEGWAERIFQFRPRAVVLTVTLRHAHRRFDLVMTTRLIVAAMATVAAFLGVGLSIAPAAQADPPYRNCTAARQDGRYNIPRGDPAYQQKLDRDNDGIACES